MSVDLPAPFSPTRAWTSPARRSKRQSRRACTPGKSLLMPSISTSGAVTTSGTRPPPSGTGPSPVGDSPVRISLDRSSYLYSSAAMSGASMLVLSYQWKPVSMFFGTDCLLSTFQAASTDLKPMPIGS